MNTIKNNKETIPTGKLICAKCDTVYWENEYCSVCIDKEMNPNRIEGCSDCEKLFPRYDLVLQVLDSGEILYQCSGCSNEELLHVQNT